MPRLRVILEQKRGRPEFSSDSAGVELEIEIDRGLLNPEQARELEGKVAALFELLEGSVKLQLERMAAAGPAPVRREWVERPE